MTRPYFFFQIARAALIVAVFMAVAAPGRTALWLPADPPASPSIHLQAGTLSPLPLAEDPAGLAEVVRSGAGTGIVQLRGPVRRSDLFTLESAGLRLRRYLPEFAFVCDGDAAAFVRTAVLPSVRWIGPYRPEYRVAPWTPVSGPAELLVAVDPSISPDLLIPSARRLGLDARVTGRSLLRVRGDASAVRALAADSRIDWIQPPAEPEPMNDRARALIGIGPLWRDFGLRGADQIIGIADTGLDSGTLETLSPDFTGRVLKGIALAGGDDWGDPHGHGTRVAGAIVGQGGLVAGLPDSSTFAGVAPRAKLIVQATALREGIETGLPDDLGDLYGAAYAMGARLHNDSWGDDFSPYGTYSLHASQTDAFVWDHPDMTIAFSAGNDGSDAPTKGTSPRESHQMGRGASTGRVLLSSLYAPGTAKNAIDVGASEGDRPPHQAWGGYADETWSAWGFKAPPISATFTGGNPSGMTPFSSRGPTADGRIKPDLVAPGSNIISTLSSRGAANNLWGPYRPGYAYNGGTSIATGFVTGAAALVREWYGQQGLLRPSAALVKATLLNGAQDLAPGQYGSSPAPEIPPAPNPVEGWGRVNAARAVAPAAPLRLAYRDSTSGLETGGSSALRLRVTVPGQPLRIMLVWSDFAGAPDASVALVNDLDLSVTGPDGRLLRGNGGGDRRNNIEAVAYDRAAPGVYRVVVTGYNVPHGPQPFAVVALGATGRMIVPGDLDGDGRLTVADVTLALRGLVGVSKLDDDQLIAAAVAPGRIEGSPIALPDVVELLRSSVGLSDPTTAP